MATATLALEGQLSIGWIVGQVGSSEVGETTYIEIGEFEDLTPDVILSSPKASYGIKGSGPMDRVAGTGTLKFTMDNSVLNSGGVLGYYTPGHTNARTGWEIGKSIRLKASFDGTDYYKFRGTLINCSPTAGTHGRRIVDCTAVDWMDDAARSRIKNLDIATDQRSDQLVTTLVTDSVTKQPAATSFAVGQSTFDYAFDNLSDAKTPVLRALADVVISELGFLYVKGDTTQGGTLKFEDRHTRPKAGAAVGDFDETMNSLEISRSRGDLINRAYVIVHPRTVDGSVTALYELTTTQTNPNVIAGQTITLIAPFTEASINAYRVAGQSLEPLVSGTDWIANSAADGSGTNLTSDVVVTLAKTSANSVTFQIVNNHATLTAYLTTLQVRGTGVRDTTQTILTASDATSERDFGEIDTRIDMKYESNAGEYGNEIAKWILNIYKDPRNVVKKMSIIGNSSDALMTQCLAREPGDKITLTEAMTGIESTGGSGAELAFFINGVDFEILKGNICKATWTLAPAEQQSAWILQTLGASECGISTNLGFA